MTNINVKIVGTANMSQVESAFGQLQAQVAALNAQLAQMVNTQKAVDPSGYQRLAKAADYNSKVFRDAAASTGLFEVQQIRLNSATDEYVKKLKSQKTSFRELIRTRKIAAAAYREQLAMEEGLTVRRNPMSNVHGKEVFDVTYPKAYSQSMDTAGRRLSWFNEQLKSGAHQMVNWGKNTQWAGRQLMVGFTIPIAAAGAAMGVLAYQTDKQLTRIAKVYDTTAQAVEGSASSMMAVERELMELREAGTQTAIAAAREYGQAATDTLSVQAELAAAGQQGAALQESTMEVMRIARLGELDYQVATEATIALQSIFRMSNEELTESFNYMNAVENATSLSTEDFATAIPVAASAVKAFGGDVQELGILLTAMKENGIAASEGANALKATMQRLGRPSKQIREEWQALTGTDITELVDGADGLMEVFSRINEATAGLDDSTRRKAFAGLFGSYQVARMMALTKGMGELEQGVGQVSRAYEIAGGSASDWADTADREMKRYTESVSGRFDIALQEAKAQLATMGEPFVELGTLALKAISALIDGFNSLPEGAQKLIAIGVAIAAVAGPVVMLTGLFANLFGNGLKAVAGMLGAVNKLGTGMGILDKENRIAAASAKMMEQGYISQTKAVQNLTIATEALAKAQQASNTASAKYAATMAVVPKMSAARKAIEDAKVQEALIQQRMTQFATLGVNDKVTYRLDNKFASQDQVRARVLSQMAAEEAAAKKATAAAAASTAESSKKTAAHMRTAAVGTAAMSAGMLLTMTNSNETANAIGNMLILGSMVVPAAISLARALGAAAKSATAASGATGLMRFLPTLVNPVGLIAAGVTAVGVGLYAWHKHLEKAKKEATALQNNVNELADVWAEKTGAVRKEYEAIAAIQNGMKDQSYGEEMLEHYMSDDMKKYVEAFANPEWTPDERYVNAMDHFATLQADYGLSAQKAAENVRALYRAAGLGAMEADQAVKDLMDDFGSLNNMRFDDLMNLQANIFFDKEQGSAEAKVAAADISKAFLQGMSGASEAEAQSLMANLTSIIDEGWTAAWANVDHEGMLGQKFAEIGITSAKELQKALTEIGGRQNFLDAYFPEGTGSGQYDALMRGEILSRLNELTGAALETETAIVSAISADPLSGLPSYISNMDELTNSWEGLGLAAKSMDMSEAKDFLRLLASNPSDQQIEGIQRNGTALEKAVLGASEKTKTMWANSILAAKGFDQAESVAQALLTILNQVPSTVNRATSAAHAFAAALNQANISTMYKDAMGSVQQQIADDYTSWFTDRQADEMDATNDYWDKRVENVNKDIDRRQAGLDAKWERKKDGAEKYWDRRIDLVDKAIEAEQKAEERRQKMFDAEVARINRLNDLANTNIDFNIALNEGKLDEAAKIRNDVQAEADEFALNRGRDQTASKSEKRISRLEDRKEGLEEAREAAMEAMQKREAAERAHLERVSEMRRAAVEEDRKIAIEAKEKELEAQKKLMEESLAVFMSGTAAEKKEMRKRMKAAGLSYEEFYKDTIKPQGLKWGEYFNKMMQQELREAAEALKSDTMWAELGNASIDEMAKSMGFSNKQQLIHFLKTGEMKNFETPSGGTDKKKGDPNDPRLRHTGGWAGKGGAGSRKGVARTYKGVHPSEVMVQARKKEFIVNEKSAAKNAGLLERINQDPNFMKGHDKIGTGGEPGRGPAPFFAAVIARGIAQQTAKAMGTAVTEKQQEIAASSAASPGKYSGAPRAYALPGVKPWVAEAANYLGGKFGITSIGGVGDRSSNPFSDHPKGLALDFMTNNVAKGWALTEEALRLKNVLDATYMIWQAQINSFDSRGWRQYSHPSGATDPTSMHMDHVHLSFTANGKAGDLPTDAPNLGDGTGMKGGNYWRASDPGKGWGNTHDYNNNRQSPLYAIGPGVVTQTVYGPEAGSGQNAKAFPRGYGSYGVLATLKTDAGPVVKYAHLWPGTVRTGRVSGGQPIALSAATGNASGYHTHFEVNGSTNAQGLFASMGIPLNKGAANVRFDNTLANLHKGEAVLTEDLNRKFHQGVENFASGGNAEYHFHINGDGMDAEAVANKVMVKLKQEEARRPVSRTRSTPRG